MSEGGRDVGLGGSHGITNVAFTREASFGDENTLPLGTSGNLPDVHGEGRPSMEGGRDSEGVLLRTPLGELPPNTIYPSTHHIPHERSIVSHTRVWLPNNFPREPRSRKNARKMAKQGACGQHARFPRGGEVSAEPKIRLACQMCKDEAWNFQNKHVRA